VKGNTKDIGPNIILFSPTVRVCIQGKLLKAEKLVLPFLDDDSVLWWTGMPIREITGSHLQIPSL
jgi:hypothetical protein